MSAKWKLQPVWQGVGELSTQMQSGCGTQYPRADACGLLAAAPTTAPCIRHWRRSLSLQAIPLPALPPAVAGTHPPDHLLRKLPAALLGKLLLPWPARGEFLRRMSGKWGPNTRYGESRIGAEPWVPGCSRRKLPERRHRCFNTAAASLRSGNHRTAGGWLPAWRSIRSRSG